MAMLVIMSRFCIGGCSAGFDLDSISLELLKLGEGGDGENGERDADDQPLPGHGTSILPRDA